jgi:hypothetical protein
MTSSNNKQTSLILPCVGRSSRFPGMRPKWSLTCPSGNLMIQESIYCLNLANISDIYLSFCNDHLKDINIQQVLSDIEKTTGKRTILTTFKEYTRNQPETVYQTLMMNDFADDEPFVVKDCDNLFSFSPQKENVVCVSAVLSGVNAANKSYVFCDKNGKIEKVIEKKDVSSMFCVGGYSFERAGSFLSSYEDLMGEENLFISDVISDIILKNRGEFEPRFVSNYTDLGTLDDYQKYCRDFQTIFIDLDGCLVENGGEYFDPLWGESEKLPTNVALLNELYDGGKTHIIITTARKSTFKEQTLLQLEKHGIKYHRILFDLPHAQRLLINDFATTNAFPTAKAINLRRNADDLIDLLNNE